MSTLKELVGNGQTVRLEFYRKGKLYYITSDGFRFTVDVEDCGDAEFLPEDKAMMFMRYIRKQLENNKTGEPV